MYSVHRRKGNSISSFLNWCSCIIPTETQRAKWTRVKEIVNRLIPAMTNTVWAGVTENFQVFRNQGNLHVQTSPRYDILRGGWDRQVHLSTVSICIFRNEMIEWHWHIHVAVAMVDWLGVWLPKDYRVHLVNRYWLCFRIALPHLIGLPAGGEWTTIPDARGSGKVRQTWHMYYFPKHAFYFQDTCMYYWSRIMKLLIRRWSTSWDGRVTNAVYDLFSRSEAIAGKPDNVCNRLSKECTSQQTL